MNRNQCHHALGSTSLICLLLAWAPISEARSETPPATRVTYLANEGFLLEDGDTRVLIDALFGDGIEGYPAVPAATREALEAGTGDWAGVDLVLATHHHGDHFDPTAVTRFLRAQPAAIFVGPPQAVEGLLTLEGNRTSLGTRSRAVLPRPGAVVDLDFGPESSGLTVQALNLHHGKRDPPVENLGYLITLGGTRIIHFGDTEATIDDFRPYLDLLRNADIALLPFWFLTSEWRMALVRDELRPRCIAVGHLPAATAPARFFGRWESYTNVVRTIREAFPNAWIPSRAGEVLPAPCGVFRRTTPSEMDL